MKTTPNSVKKSTSKVKRIVKPSPSVDGSFSCEAVVPISNFPPPKKKKRNDSTK